MEHKNKPENHLAGCAQEKTEASSTSRPSRVSMAALYHSVCCVYEICLFAFTGNFCQSIFSLHFQLHVDKKFHYTITRKTVINYVTLQITITPTLLCNIPLRTGLNGVVEKSFLKCCTGIQWRRMERSNPFAM